MRRIPALLAALVLMVAVTPPASAETRDSPHWVGYGARDPEGFRSVSARWTVPAYVGECSGNRWAAYAVWVGMGGQDGGATDTVEQTGTIAECRDGTVEHWAFVEAYPAEAELLFEVQPGDVVDAQITMRDGVFDFLVADSTSKRWEDGTRATTGLGRTAEVVVESPDGEYFRKFDPVHFRKAKINGRSIGLLDLTRWTLVDYDGDHPTEPRVVRAWATHLFNAGTAFDVHWLSE
ncbi:G1 family glutamic endopeptidase [Actinosynnema sp. NPDC049800]